MAGYPRRRIGVTGVGGPCSVILAVAENGVIGRDGRLPWRIPADLRWFKDRTWGHTVIMGRRTWESLGRPLPGRRNLVVSRTEGLAVPGAEVVPSLLAALERAWAEGDQEPFVIGGARLYEEALAGAATRVWWTEVPGSWEGDVRVAPLDGRRWEEVGRTSGEGCAFVEYRRRIELEDP